ncbi:PAS domain S-box-containing protein [Mucilaginibacter lappiensis]|uniref:histidine kinase n=1 Tax=Mucilaginibacter lappiensis TaxID=354630 RepID=A0ABR6PDH5_9SPHI|nr:PAS domain S-box protein [Mucilaginibacter lappiensis]MBB6107793.1 PAS domain S-box-containing protein [Mucilaginibacter lappiensis]SIP96965.1 PAS domain S-box-containing protein [Mucilaginibacter lappiensis]
MTPYTRKFNNDDLVAILALSKDATAIYSTEDLLIEMANDAMIGFWGKDRSVIGKTFSEAVPELIGQPFFDLLKNVWRTGVTYEAKNTAAQLRVDGELKWFYYDFIYRALKNETGEVYCILHTATDVTELCNNRLLMLEGKEREQNLAEELTASNEELAAANEELLRSQDNLLNINTDLEARVAARVAELSESEQRFRNMSENTDVMIAMADETSKGVYFNKAWVNLTGKSEADLLEFGWAELIHPDDKDRWLKTYLAAAEKQASVKGEFRILSKAGDYRWLLANIPARFRSDGTFAGYISSCIDITDRKNNEQQLAQIISILPAAVVVIRGNDLVVESVNKANLAYWNKTKEQVIGKPLLEILPELASQPFPGQLRQVMKTGEVIDVKESPVIFAAPDGTQRETFVDYTYQPLSDINGKRTGVLVMSFEITDRVVSRKLLEQFSNDLQAMNEELTASNEELAAVNEELLTAHQRIEEGEAALRLAIDAAEFGTWYIHSVTREFITDARLKELFGYYPEEELNIEGALAQITEEYRGYVAEKLENAIYHNGDYDVTYPVIGFHDNQLRWLRAIGNLKADPSGAFSAFTGVVMDITEQHLAAKKVERAEESLRMAIDAAGLGTYFINATDRIFYPSPRLKEFFGFRKDEEVPYDAAINQIHPDYRKQAADMVEAAFTKGERFDMEYPVIGHHDGSIRWVRGIGTMQHYDGKDFFTGVLHDITENKQDEIRKNDFIGMVSHELKTPLTTLTALVQIVNTKLKYNEDSFLTGAMDKANTQVKKMSNMINGFLNISRLESGKLMIVKQPFKLEELLLEIIDEIKMTMSSHEIQFAPCDPVQVNGDRDKIGSVISNLLSNAIKYSPRGKFVTVNCQVVDGHAKVSIRDEGIGIKPKDAERLFDRYYRVEDSGTKHISGFGIGLYLSAEIIKRHEGKIWVESEVGIGSTFYFSIPLN